MGLFKKHFQIWRQLGVAGHYILSSHLKPNSPVTSVIQSYLGHLFKTIFSEFETKSNSKRHTIWLTVTDSSHKVSTIKSIYINMKIYLLKDLSKNLIKYTNSLLARVKCECYSLGQMSPSNALQLNKLRRNRTVTSTRSLAKTGKNNMENSGWWNIEGAFHI